MHFVTMADALEARRAIVLSGLALVPYASIFVDQFVHTWRASSVLGQELLEDYVSHVIEHAHRDTFFRCGIRDHVLVKALMECERTSAS